MKPGPKPKPTRLKVVEGNRGKRPLNDQEPDPDPIKEIPDPPYFLTLLAKRYWRANLPGLIETGVCTVADLPAFTILCEYWSTWRYAENKARKVKMEHKTPKGHKQTSHYANISKDASKNFTKLAAEFGMTPSSRSGVKSTKKATKKNSFEDI